jgi:hypothetical protein
MKVWGWVARYLTASGLLWLVCHLMGRWTTERQAQALDELADSLVDDPRYEDFCKW